MLEQIFNLSFLTAFLAAAVRLAVPELEKIAGAKGWINVCKEPEKSE